MFCSQCSDTKWLKVQQILSHSMWSPCQSCLAQTPGVPDYIVIPSWKSPESVRISQDVTVCLAGNSAINGCCGELDCVCAPVLLPHVSRLQDESGEPYYFSRIMKNGEIEVLGFDGRLHNFDKSALAMFAPPPPAAVAAFPILKTPIAVDDKVVPLQRPGRFVVSDNIRTPLSM